MTSTQQSDTLIVMLKPDEFRLASKIVLVFVLFFYTFYGLAAYLADYIPYKFIVGFEFEKAIPFIPEMAAIYLTVSPMMLLSVLIIRQESHLYALLKVLCLQTFIGFLCFLVFPVKTNFPALDSHYELAMVYQIADLINLKNNEFPSLHVCFAATMSFVFASRSGLLLSVLFYLWAFLIACSTLLIHEHNLLDIVAGYMLAWWGMRRWQTMIAKDL